MSEKEDRVLDEEQWKSEARAVIDDVRGHVNELGLSNVLRSTNRAIYLNLTTLEGLRFCIELSALGFTVVGNRHDDTSNAGNGQHFETPYSLLDSVSPLYRNSFGSSLVDKLNQLQSQE